MEPTVSPPIGGPESAPSRQPQPGGEVFHAPQTPEAPKAPLEQKGETREVYHDQPTGQGQQPQPVAPAVLDVNLTTATPTPVAAPVDANPSVAADVDVMEKEWVVKAKEIDNQTKNDPHEQGSAVSLLKVDYQMKRYGKAVKQATSGG